MGAAGQVEWGGSFIVGMIDGRRKVGAEQFDDFRLGVRRCKVQWRVAIGVI